MCIFAPDNGESEIKSNPEQCKNAPFTSTNMQMEQCKNAPSTGAKMHPLLKYINTNDKREKKKFSLSKFN
jgi:hypothetical protein